MSGSFEPGTSIDVASFFKERQVRNEGPMSLKSNMQTEHDDFQKEMTLNEEPPPSSSLQFCVSCWFWAV